MSKMDGHKHLEPRLMILDGIGEGNANPSPYTLRWWLKQILEALGGGTGAPFDMGSGGLVGIDFNSYTTIFEYIPTTNVTFDWEEIQISLTGMMAHIKVEYSKDGVSSSVVRDYVLSTQQNTHTEKIGNKGIPLVLDSNAGYIKVSAKMAYKNQEGHVSAYLSGALK